MSVTIDWGRCQRGPPPQPKHTGRGNLHEAGRNPDDPENLLDGSHGFLPKYEAARRRGHRWRSVGFENCVNLGAALAGDIIE